MPLHVAGLRRFAAAHRIAYRIAYQLRRTMCLAVLALVACTPPPPQQAARPAPSPGPSPVELMKSDLVERLAQCESRGQSIYSPGGLYVGPLQFHRGTVVGYYKILYGQQITHKDAVEIAMDPQRAHQLAKDIIFTSGNKVRDWPLCSRKLGLATEVDRILAMPQ